MLFLFKICLLTFFESCFSILYDACIKAKTSNQSVDNMGAISATSSSLALSTTTDLVSRVEAVESQVQNLQQQLSKVCSIDWFTYTMSKNY